MTSIERIAAKVESAGLLVKAPIALAEVEQFELEAGISIPGDYRDFLLHVANGGIEPCRLVPLSCWDASYWIDDPRPAMVAKPCIVTTDAWDHGEYWLDRANEPDWKKRWDRGVWSPMFGTIAVAEIGCGLFYSVVMTGELRGRIFSWGDHALIPPYVYPEANFGEWIDACLDTTLAGRPMHFLDGRIQ